MLHHEHPAIRALGTMKAEFYPIGSRYIGVETPTSDYDFMAKADNQSLQPLVDELKRVGFQTLSAYSGHAVDPQFFCIMRWQSNDEPGMPTVDIFVGTSDVVDRRLAAYAAFRRAYLAGGQPARAGLTAFMESMRVSNRALIWRTLFNVFEHHAEIVRSSMKDRR